MLGVRQSGHAGLPLRPPARGRRAARARPPLRARDPRRRPGAARPSTPLLEDAIAARLRRRRARADPGLERRSATRLRTYRERDRVTVASAPGTAATLGAEAMPPSRLRPARGASALAPAPAARGAAVVVRRRTCPGDAAAVVWHVGSSPTAHTAPSRIPAVAPSPAALRCAHRRRRSRPRARVGAPRPRGGSRPRSRWSVAVDLGRSRSRSRSRPAAGSRGRPVAGRWRAPRRPRRDGARERAR